MKLYFIVLSIFFSTTSLVFGQDKPRIIVETDIGGDADDQATLVRFLLYANEFDTEGIILSRPKSKYCNSDGSDPFCDDPTNSTDPYMMTRRYLAGYGEVVANLNAHAPTGRKYPSRSYLDGVTKWAHDVNDRPSDAGVNLIIKALKKNDSRPIWFTNWGSNDRTGSSLKRALDKIKNSNQGITYQNAVDKIKFVEYENLNGSSLIGSHISEVSYVMDTFLPGCGHTRWAARWASLTGDKNWIKERGNVSNRLSRYYTTSKEGDTMTWMHLIDNGINVIGSPELGGWSGRYTNLSNSNTSSDCPNFPNSSNNRFWKCYVRDASPTNSVTNRDNTLIRWGTNNKKSTDIINDFRARWKWTRSATRTSANHAPVPKVVAKKIDGSLLNTSSGTTPLLVKDITTGIDIQLDASTSTDPDNNTLKYQWSLYKEITKSNLRGIVITSPNSAKTTIKIPAVNTTGKIELYLRVTDVPGGSQIPITRYQRVTLRPSGPPTNPKIKLVNQANQDLPTNLILNHNTSYQIKAQITAAPTPINKVEFYSNGKKVAEDATAPYIYNFSRSQPGTYKLRARLWYNNNTESEYSSESTIRVSIPTVRLVNQANQALPANLILNRTTSYQIKAQTTIASSPINKVEFYSNGTKVSQDVTAPYVYSFSRSQLGSYKIKARLWYNNNTSSVYSNESTITIKDGIIASIQPNSSRSYKAMKNFGKVKYFTDSNYKVTIHPSFLNSAEYIMTPNADKSSTTANLLTIRINKPADIYVAYDRRLPRIPVWLRAYTDTREHVRTADGAIFRLYKKKFNPGNVVLGGNESRQSNSSNYFVIVQKPLVLPPTKLITSIQVNSSRSYKAMANFGKVLYYTDRSDKVTIYPSYLANAEYVKTPNSDKSVRNDNLLTLNLKEAADVYVAYDRRLTRIPVWLRSYTDTREHIRTSHGTIYRIYKKRFAAGRAVLGGNESRQSNSSNYFVVAKAVYSAGSSLRIASKTKNTDVDFKPYPVPTTDQVFINISEEKSWNLINIQGRVILEGKGSAVDLTEFTDGMYFIQTDTKTYKVFKKSM